MVSSESEGEERGVRSNAWRCRPTYVCFQNSGACRLSCLEPRGKTRVVSESKTGASSFRGTGWVDVAVDPGRSGTTRLN